MDYNNVFWEIECVCCVLDCSMVCVFFVFDDVSFVCEYLEYVEGINL